MHTASLLAGLSWDPAIRGILSVGVGAVVLLGSVYLLLGTNLGFRLGGLVAASGLTGFLTILTLIWWIQPPGIGPRGGNDPHWVPLEIYVNPVGVKADQPALAAANRGETAPPPATNTHGDYPFPYNTPTAQKVSDLQNQVDKKNLTAQLPKNYSLSDVQSLTDIDPSVKDILPSREDLNGWKIVPTSQAGEAQAAADVALANSGLFKDATEYKKLEVYDKGGNPTPEEDCPNGNGPGKNPKNLIPDDWQCRLWSRIVKTFRLSHPEHFQIVNVQRVVPQETVAGQAPPIPVADPTQPVVSVIMIRDQGNVRVKPAAFFVICLSLFLFFTLLLHFRDKTAAANRALEPDSPAARYAAKREAEARAARGDGGAGVDNTPDDGGG